MRTAQLKELVSAMSRSLFKINVGSGSVPNDLPGYGQEDKDAILTAKRGKRWRARNFSSKHIAERKGQ